jgi:hypothetical protein
MAASNIPASDTRGRSATASGWPLFVGLYLGIAGTFNFIWGISAVSKADPFSDGGLVLEGLQTWGWIAIVAGIAQVGAAWAIAARKMVGIWVAAWFAFMGLLLHFVAIGAYPLWSSVIIVLNALVLWAVTVHSDEFADF